MLENRLKIIQRQFFCCVPVAEIDWDGFLEELSWDQQDFLIRDTVINPRIAKHPLKVSYQKAFLKHIIQAIGESSLHDSVYDSYGALVATPEHKETYKHYFINPDLVLVLKENANFISEGTTGLCTWQAGIALAEWCIQNKGRFKGKTIVELGSGIGLTALTITKCTEASKIVASDCHESVLINLEHNIALNVENKSRNLNASSLPWETVSEDIVSDLNADLILAADVIYDNSLFGSLVGAVKCFLNFKPTSVFVLACTERNLDTLKEFLQLLDCEGLSCRKLSAPKAEHFWWPQEPPVRFFEISKGLVSGNA